MNMYKNQKSWNEFNKKMSDIFGVSYHDTEMPTILFEEFHNSHTEPWNKGLKLGKEWSEQRKKYIFTTEQYEKVLNHLNNLRKTMYTKERSKKISDSLKGYKMTEERKQNISNAKKGKRYTTEQKAAKSEAMKKWHLNRKAHIHKDPSI